MQGNSSGQISQKMVAPFRGHFETIVLLTKSCDHVYRNESETKQSWPLTQYYKSSHYHIYVLSSLCKNHHEFHNKRIFIEGAEFWHTHLFELVFGPMNKGLWSTDNI